MDNQNTTRSYWLKQMLRIAFPVFASLAEDKLKKNMPVDERRARFAHLEAFGRTLAGIAPWLAQGKSDPLEEKDRQDLLQLVRRSMAHATNPDSHDFMNFSEDYQPIVDAAFLAHAVVRAPEQLYSDMDNGTRANLIKALKATRSRKPYNNNWLLFSAMIETALHVMGEECDHMRIDYAIKQHMQWYKGDGLFGDGKDFHFDYYNSYVIQPMLIDILETMGHLYEDWRALIENVKIIGRRYAAIQERMISPEGTFPPVGRSLVYRFGAFQHLSQMALQKNLPDGIHPAQVRCALTAVIKRMIEMPGTFDAEGWLTPGFCGNQPSLAEPYISTGSLYLCSTVFLPLGLDGGDPFWSGEERDWTAKKIWGGHNQERDSALSL